LKGRNNTNKLAQGLRPFRTLNPVKQHQGIYRLVNLLLKPDWVKEHIPFCKLFLALTSEAQ
jgi:hypothetical protein